MLRAIAFCALVATSTATALSPKPQTLPVLRTKNTVLCNALELRGGGIVPQDGYVKASMVIYAVYALQFFGIPKKFIADHFTQEPDDLHIFLARGSGLAIAFGAWAMSKLSADVSFLPILIYNVLVGLVYPWNAAYISKLPVKYPMHYVPEVLMAALSIAGLLAL